MLREHFAWKKVTAPKIWHPSPGEELCGYYGGRTLKNGRWGQYEVILVHVPHEGTFTISGTVLINLIDAACIPLRHPILVKFVGWVPLKSDEERVYKKFELSVAIGVGLAPEDVPEVPEVQPQ